MAAIVSVAVICVALTTVTVLAVTPVEETATVAPDTKFVPVRVTGTLAPWAPLDGAIEVRVGGSGDGEDDGAGSPERRGDRDGARSGRRTRGDRQGGGDLTSRSPRRFADGDAARGDRDGGAGMKFVPVRVTGTAAPGTPTAGVTALRVGAAVTDREDGGADPPAVVTVTLREPAAAVEENVRVAVI